MRVYTWSIGDMDEVALKVENSSCSRQTPDNDEFSCTDLAKKRGT